MAKNWLQQLQKLNGAKTEDYNPFLYTIDTPSPSVNFIFGGSWGLPRAYTAVLFGPPKSGKTVLEHAIAGKLHQDDDEAFVVKFDTELRTDAQLTKEQRRLWGIDDKRLITIEGNTPDIVFDQFDKEINALCADGCPIKLAIIDSINGIQGRRALNAESIMNQQIGDHALTIQEGMKRILHVQRKHKIALLITAQVRAEMDPIAQMRGQKYKMAASFGLQHHAEYFILMEPNLTKEGRVDATGKELRNEELTDMAGKSEQTGHKIKVTMRDSSLGPKGRVGEFTFDYHKGIINVHEEVFKLGVGRGVIERPNQTAYVFREQKWVGKQDMIEALRQDTDLQKAIVKELKVRDQLGKLGAVPESGIVTEEEVSA